MRAQVLTRQAVARACGGYLGRLQIGVCLGRVRTHVEQAVKHVQRMTAVVHERRLAEVQAVHVVMVVVVVGHCRRRRARHAAETRERPRETTLAT